MKKDTNGHWRSGDRCARCGVAGWTEAADWPCDKEIAAAREEEKDRKLTRHEQLQALADSGTDTWEEYRGER